MIQCGKVCVNCDYPIHMDTYKGCSHGCVYCRVKRAKNIDKIIPIRTVKGLKNFIDGKRNKWTKWCDWRIPIQWGANSDPFQECEHEYGASLECLKVLAEKKYPFIITTKNPVLLTEEPYFSLLKECRVIVQCSMACSRYDKLEPKAPKYEERLSAMAKLSPVVTRTAVRLSPFFPDAIYDIIENIPRLSEAGIHGVLIEGFCSNNAHPQMKRYGGRYMFPNDVLYPLFHRIRSKCHDVGITFTAVESGLSWMSDSTRCCCSDGLDDFIPNLYTLDHIAQGDSLCTDAQRLPCHAPFEGFRCNQAWNLHVRGRTFKDLVDEQAKGYPEWFKAERMRLENGIIW